MRYRAGLLVLVTAVGAAAGDESPSAFGFREDRKVKSSIDTSEIMRGHPRARKLKDLIPAIWDPEHVPAKAATWLRSDERVLGLFLNGEARAYPLRVLERHEMVNDVVGGRPVAPNY